MITVFGLKNCDTCRKALAWLKAEGIGHEFHDVRADGLARDRIAGLARDRIAGWAEAAGWDTLLNRRGTAWRNLPEADREDVDGTRAIALMHAHPALIKRPVFETDGTVLVGFADDVKAALKS